MKLVKDDDDGDNNNNNNNKNNNNNNNTIKNQLKAQFRPIFPQNISG